MIVYTTVLGPTDRLEEQVHRGNARFVCFTDQPIRSATWELVRMSVQDRPKRACRRLKLLPHVTFPGEPVTLWMDCCFRLKVPPEQIARNHSGQVTAFRHHRRQRIKDEAQAIIKARKALPHAVLAQLAAYQADGWDTDDNPQRAIHNGGFLLRRDTPDVRAFSEAWHHEVETRTLRDQMSVDYVAWKLGLRIDEFPGTCRANPYADLRVNVRKPTNDF